MLPRSVRSLLAAPLYVLLTLVGYGIRAAIAVHRALFFALLWAYPEFLLELRDKYIARSNSK